MIDTAISLSTRGHFRILKSGHFNFLLTIDTLKAHDVQISMDGKGCYRDNILVERLWRTVKYEHLYTRTFENVKAVRDSLVQWFDWYNRERFHQSLDNRTPDEVYYACQTYLQAA